MIKIGIKGWDLPSISSLNQKQLGCSSQRCSTLTQQRICSTLCPKLWHPQSPHQLSLPGSLARLTEKPFKWNYSGLTKWRRRKWADCAAMPCLTCASLSVLAPFPGLLLSSWPSRSCTTAGKYCPKSISIKYYRDYNHPDPHSSAMECNC